MAKKIKKRAKTGSEFIDPLLEEVEADRAFEVELDEETNEIIFVHHYRRKWGDEFEADIEHGLNMEEASELVGIMIMMIEAVKMKLLVDKSTLTPIEKNPMKDNPVQ
jgi:hypothetical protein